MAVYSVTYDLRKEGQDYASLISHLESYEHCKYQKSCWIIKSNLSAKDLYQKIREFMDANDHILVIEVTQNYYGFSNSSTWDIIKALFN